MLRTLGAVAEVPRSEDVGIDAVVSLLRPDSDGNVYAEDSFVVQLKTASQPPMSYADHEFVWLMSQSLPMFIGRVSVDECSVELFSTILVDKAVWATFAESVTIQFGVRDTGGAWNTAHERKHADVWLGPPVLSWNVSHTRDPAWHSNAYAILKRFLEKAVRERELLKLHQSSQLRWQTNDLSSIRSAGIMQRGHPDELPAMVAKCEPCLRSLMMLALFSTDESGARLALALLAFVAGLRERGIDIDPNNSYATLFQTLHAPNGDEASDDMSATQD